MKTMTKEQWVALLVLLGQTDRETYRAVRAFCWEAVTEEKRKKFSRVSRLLN